METRPGTALSSGGETIGGRCLRYAIDCCVYTQKERRLTTLTTNAPPYRRARSLSFSLSLHLSLSPKHGRCRMQIGGEGTAARAGKGAAVPGGLGALSLFLSLSVPPLLSSVGSVCVVQHRDTRICSVYPVYRAWERHVRTPPVSTRPALLCSRWSLFVLLHLSMRRAAQPTTKQRVRVCLSPRTPSSFGNAAPRARPPAAPSAIAGILCSVPSKCPCASPSSVRPYVCGCTPCFPWR